MLRKILKWSLVAKVLAWLRERRDRRDDPYTRT